MVCTVRRSGHRSIANNSLCMVLPSWFGSKGLQHSKFKKLDQFALFEKYKIRNIEFTKSFLLVTLSLTFLSGFEPVVVAQTASIVEFPALFVLSIVIPLQFILMARADHFRQVARFWKCKKKKRIFFPSKSSHKVPWNVCHVYWFEFLPAPSVSMQTAVHSGWVSNLLSFPSHPPYQNLEQPPYCMSKNHFWV